MTHIILICCRVYRQAGAAESNRTAAAEQSQTHVAAVVPTPVESIVPHEYSRPPVLIPWPNPMPFAAIGRRHDGGARDETWYTSKPPVVSPTHGRRKGKNAPN